MESQSITFETVIRYTFFYVRRLPLEYQHRVGENPIKAIRREPENLLKIYHKKISKVLSYSKKKPTQMRMRIKEK